jgi:hypothetical protein
LIISIGRRKLYRRTGSNCRHNANR